MTPLFAPKPPPPGVAFGPDFGDRRRSQQLAWPGWNHQAPPPWPATGPATGPAGGVPGAYGGWPTPDFTAAFGQGFGGVDPWARLRGGHSWGEPLPDSFWEARR